MYELPPSLQERLSALLQDKYTHVLEVFGSERIGSFRINALKNSEDEVFQEFQEKNIQIVPFPEISGVFLFDRKHEYAIKGTRSFYDGKIYLQSIASLLPAIVLAPKSGSSSVLDICAAPGSKTTQMAALMENTGNITALEQNQIRYDKLVYNTKLQGATNIHAEKVDAEKFLGQSEGQYDKILLDAPCSAEGRISLANEKTYGFWSIENIRKKSELQTRLIDLAWRHLKIGGTLVYSTCTLAPEENEGVISDLLEKYSDAELETINIGLDTKDWWTKGITEWKGVSYNLNISKTVRILPSEKTEGFFLAKLRKK